VFSSVIGSLNSAEISRISRISKMSGDCAKPPKCLEFVPNRDSCLEKVPLHVVAFQASYPQVCTAFWQVCTAVYEVFLQEQQNLMFFSCFRTKNRMEPAAQQQAAGC
jgi:hypothetical protein